MLIDNVVRIDCIEFTEKILHLMLRKWTLGINRHLFDVLGLEENLSLLFQQLL